MVVKQWAVLKDGSKFIMKVNLWVDDIESAEKEINTNLQEEVKYHIQRDEIAKIILTEE